MKTPDKPFLSEEDAVKAADERYPCNTVEDYDENAAYVKPFIEMVLWTDSTSDGKSYQIISTGNSTGDTKRVLVKDYFNKNCKIA